MRQKFHIDFVKNSKIFFCISLAIMVAALIVNIFVLPTRVDIQFTGGTIVKYSYSGNLTEKQVSDVAQKATKDTITFTFAENLASSDSNSHLVSLQFMGNKAISVDEQDSVTDALTKAFPKNTFKVEQSTVVDASKGANFFFKCLAAVILAAVRSCAGKAHDTDDHQIEHAPENGLAHDRSILTRSGNSCHGNCD